MELDGRVFLLGEHHQSSNTLIDWRPEKRPESDPASSHPHPGGLLASSDGVVLEGELVLPDDGSAVFVPDVRHHVHVWRPHLKLSLPVDDGGEGGADQERPLRVALRGGDEVSVVPCSIFSSSAYRNDFY